MQTTTITTTTNGNKPPPIHVAVCAFPFGGHATTLLNLIRRMSAAAEEEVTSSADVIFTFINIESSNASLFNTLSNNTKSSIVPCSLPGGDVYAGMPHMEAFVGFMEDSAVALRRGVAAAEAEVGAEVSCVVGDAFLSCCGEIAEEKGVPWVCVWTSGPASLACHLYTDVLKKRFLDVQESMDEKVGDCVPGFTNIPFCDIPSNVVQNFDTPFGKMLYKMAQLVPKATAVVINCFAEFAPTVTKDLILHMNVFNLGPFSSLLPPQVDTLDEYGCIPWLDHKKNPKSVVYIAFGTFSVPPHDEMVALAEALEVAKVPFIWSISDRIKKQLPPSFLQYAGENGRVCKMVPWAPQRRILGHANVGVFITHCGWNSVLESIASAMPMICRSIIGDQMLNQRYVEHELKFGFGVEGGVFTKDSVVNALQQTLFGEVGLQLRDKAMMLKKIVDENTREGGRFDQDVNALMELVTRERK